MKNRTLALAIALALSSSVYADDKDTVVEHISIFGSADSVNDVPGSAAILSKDDIEEHEYTDVMRLLTQVSGVYVLEEDGYGLRPNIGMRGTGMNRSEKVTIMEDGVLAAPAPYASPSAYYFPTIGRMNSVEVLKGTSAIMFGPRTTGGVLNMTSVAIPSEDKALFLDTAYGSDEYYKVHTALGGNAGQFGGVVELFSYGADGFKKLPGGQGTGFEKNDVVAKLGWNSAAGDKYTQQFELKFKFSDEVSDETYMGISDDDFAQTPFVRYSASQKDQMDTEHKQVQFNHYIQLGDVDVTTTAYNNDFHRNWYKVSKVDGKSLGADVIALASAHDKGQVGDLAVDIKANNRDYLSRGIQTKLEWQHGNHDFTLGARYHEDEMDRYQWVDKYSLVQQRLTLNTAGVAGTDSNRIDSAKATAVYFHDQWSIDQFVVSAGLRFEDITMERHDWGKSDPQRGEEPSHKQNDLQVWLPAVGFTYSVNEETVLLAGVQKGFAPPSPGNNKAEEESSWNYEAGLRHSNQSFSVEAIAFFSDYSNMHGNCTASQGCDEDLIDNQYNAGKVEVSGIELGFNTVFKKNGLSMPMQLGYTYSKTEFQNDFGSAFETWGDVMSGDELPYLPKHQAHASFGLEADGWRMRFAARYVGELRTVAGQGHINSSEKVDDRVVVDFAAHYQIAENQEVYLTLDNLLDKEYVASRVHGSVQPGKPRTAILGYKYQF